MKVALIHATTTAVAPIERAFRDEASGSGAAVELLHLMDTGLLAMMEAEGELTPGIVERMAVLLDLAMQSQTDCIQLTCSAFNEAVLTLQPRYGVKLFRSDEAMLDEALAYERIGLVSTVRQTPVALLAYLKARKPDVRVRSLVEPGLIHLLFQGRRKEHDERIVDMVRELDGHVDVIVLSQYSMDHVAEQVRPSVPLLTAPAASARRCLAYLTGTRRTSRTSR
ncbi:aspartate/glutamate racemase family protein [Paenibacillus koleovorans]|uniref:aspartate/glutamate racemase family protein n=1 Tax=Paenibacillus koleovorans TaxID=121608 RepID=UPI000FDAC8D7|nr:aspartate/glutamate racemase family protein [Paenibacillus koleovorans]